MATRSVLIESEHTRAENERRRAITFSTKLRRLDVLLLAALAGIAVLGLDALAQGGGNAALVLRQRIYLLVGALAFAVFSLIDVELLRRYQWWFYSTTIGLIAGVFAFGRVTRGSARWIQLPSFQLQPSEFGKLALLLALAAFIADRADRIQTTRFVLLCLGYAAIPIVLVFIEPDLGTSLVYVASLLVVLFIAGVRARVFAAFGLMLVLVAVGVLWALPRAGVEVLKPYQTARLTSFLHPAADRQNTGFNQYQAGIAVGAGGMAGRGASGATQSASNLLPEDTTDFAFASYAEQRGFVGAVILLALYLVVLWRVLRTVAIARTLYGRLIASGVFGWLLASIVINIGMNIGVAPVTGIPLPLVSFGGSNTVTLLAALGVVQAISLRSRLPIRTRSDQAPLS